MAHLSYLIGDGTAAAVIDPRRDCRIYLDEAAREGVSIDHIFETHRNEDYVIGSIDLASRSGAEIHHGGALNFKYGSTVSEGDVFDIGDIRLRVLETPGHTVESISLVVTDTNFGDDPVAVFTGDALFVGDVGRTDFFPDRAEEVAGLLYDSIFEKLLPLGDQTILYPAHGAGSVCGDSMASREFSTLGHERMNNPVLKLIDKRAFVKHKVAEKHYQPPYFKRMERCNQEGAPPMCEPPRPKPMSVDAVAEALEQGSILVDLRSPEAFAGAFVPGSLAIPLDMLPAYAGYFLDYDHDLMLLPETPDQIAVAARYLVRMGYDRLRGYLAEGIHALETSVRDYDKIGALTAYELDRRLKADDDFVLLDVRKITEFEEERLPHATHIFLGELPDRLEELDKDKPIVTFCGSGRRAIIAASILKKAGFDHVEDNLGSMAACEAIGCQIEKGSQ